MALSASNVILYGQYYSNNSVMPVAVSTTGQIILDNPEPSVLSLLDDMSLQTIIPNNSLLQFDGTTNKWTNVNIGTGNIIIYNCSVNNTLSIVNSNINNGIFAGNIQISNTLIMRDANTSINSLESGNLNIISTSGNINVNANAGINIKTNISETLKLLKQDGTQIGSINQSASGNNYISYGVTDGESGYGFKSISSGNILIKNELASSWDTISNTNIVIGNTSIVLGSSYAGIDVSNSTGYNSSNLIGSIPLDIIDDGSLTNSKLVSTTITLGTRVMTLGGTANTISLSNMSDVIISAPLINHMLTRGAANWGNTQGATMISSNILVRNATDTQGISVTNTSDGNCGVYIGYDYSKFIAEGRTASLISTANSSSRYAAVFHNIRNDVITNSTFIVFTRSLSNGTVIGTGTISNSTTATLYNTSSDYRLKSNIRPLTNGLDKVLQMKPVSYTWINSWVQSTGFIAHELAEVVPDAVSGYKDQVNGVYPVYQGLETNLIIVYIVNAIQILCAEIILLESELANLKL